MLKKVVVLFPYPDEKGTYGQKTYNDVTVLNNERGELVIAKEDVSVSIGGIHPPDVIALFKDWIYWEKVE